VSSIVFHATSFPAAVNILATDTLGKGRWDVDVVSFTRSVHGSYHKINKLIGIIFEFDGDMLNQDFKGKPVGTEYSDFHDEFDDEDDSKPKYDHRGDEVQYGGRANAQLEDRLYIDKKGIQNVSKYIKSAIVYVPKEYLDRSSGDEFEDESYYEQFKSAKKAIRLLKDRNIPYTVVKNEKDLSKFRPKGRR